MVRWTRTGLLGLVVSLGLIVMAGLTAQELLTVTRQLNVNTGENMLWMVTQTAREVERLGLLLVQDAPSDDLREGLEFRLDMLSSRLRILQEGPVLAFFTHYEQLDLIQELQSHVDRLYTLIETAPLSQTLMDHMDQQLLPMRDLLGTLSNATMIAERDAFGIKFDKQHSAALRLFYFGLALLVMVVGLALQLFRSYRRQIRISEELDRHRKDLEGIVSERTTALHQALETERQAKEGYRSFITTVSHQFGTPLAVIYAISQKMTRRPESFTPERLAQKAARISAATQRLIELMGSVSQIASHDAQELRPARRDVDLNEVVHSAIASLSETAGSHSILFDPTPLPLCPCDPVLIEQVVQNLLSNAVKFSPLGAPILVEARAEDGFVQVTVIDEGIGIPLQDQPRILERFARGSNAQTIAGTGLGLNLSQSILGIHGGHLSFVSRPDHGSSFTLHLPYEVS